MRIDTNSAAAVRAGKKAREFAQKMAGYNPASPDTAQDALMRARYFAVALADAVGAAAGCPRDPPDEDQAVFLKQLRDGRHIDYKEADAFHEIRKISNRAAHDEPFTAGDVAKVREQMEFLSQRSGLGVAFSSSVPTPRPAPSATLTRISPLAAPKHRVVQSPAALHGPASNGLSDARNQNFRLAMKYVTLVLISALMFGLLYACQPGNTSILRSIADWLKPSTPAPGLQSLPGRARYKVTPDDHRSPVMMRADPNTSASVVDRLAPGTVVVATAFVDGTDGIRWMNVNSKDGLPGWVSEQFLTKLPPKLSSVRIGSQYTSYLEGPQPNGVLAGDPATAAIEFEWQNATEGQTAFDVQLSPDTVGIDCASTASTMDGRAGCNLGQVPAGSYRATITADGNEIGTVRFTVVANGPEEDADSDGPSFDCATTRSWSESMICASPSLASLDRDMAASYKQLIDEAERSRQFTVKGEQRAWLSKRERCRSDAAASNCLQGLYESRIHDLQAQLTALAKANSERYIESRSRSLERVQGGRSYSAPATNTYPSVPNRGTPATPVGDPRKWFSIDDYPSGAERRREEGTTGVALIVEIDGRVLNCSVERSSGSADLDRKTCEVFLRRARYSAAVSEFGLTIRSTVHRTVSWRLANR